MEGRVWKKVDYIVVILQSKFTIQKGEDKKVNVKSLYFTSLARKSHHLALVVQTLDSVMHWINHYPGDSVIDFPNTYPLDSAIQRLNNRGLTDKPEVHVALIFLRSALPHLTDIKRYSKHSLCIATPPPPPTPSSIFFWVKGVAGHRLLKATRRYKERKGVETKIWGYPLGTELGNSCTWGHTPINCSNPCS